MSDRKEDIDYEALIEELTSLDVHKAAAYALRALIAKQSTPQPADAALAICADGIPDAERMVKELRELCDRSINAGGERYILPNTDRYLLIWVMDVITTANAALRARAVPEADVRDSLISGCAKPCWCERCHAALLAASQAGGA